MQRERRGMPQPVSNPQRKGRIHRIRAYLQTQEGRLGVSALRTHIQAHKQTVVQGKASSLVESHKALSPWQLLPH